MDWDALMPIILTGMASGLVTWGAVRTDLKWLRRDTDLAHERIDEIEHELRDAPARVVERRTARVRRRTRR